MSRWRIIGLVAAKDLRIERRSRVVTNQVLPFGVVTLVLFAFALDAKSVETENGVNPIFQLVTPGLVAMATLFSLLLVVQRSFAVESDDGALDALRVAGVDPAAIFWGKSLALGLELLVLEVIFLLGALVLYDVGLPLGGVPLLAGTMVAATSGLAFVGTLYGGLIAGFAGRETLLPLLVLPVVAPVLIGATRAFESALGTGGVALAEGWPWLGLLAVFAIAFGVGGALAFGPLIDEAT